MIEAVIFDYNRTLVQGDENPPRFFPETQPVLQLLKDRGLKMAVVSVGDNPQDRLEEFEFLHLDRYFDVFDIVGPEGVKKFQHILEQLKVTAQRCVVVGDRVKSEILEGNRVGATTVWLQLGKFANEKPEGLEEEPKFTIKSLSELITIIDSLL
ncbi:HAD hydrolase-like protein [Candidatus Daviesbacteria bacterium]|nr:HAD hydrolase-like protein [Candidatus Daviesbacteria bacterium]